MKMSVILLFFLCLSAVAIYQWHNYSSATVTEISLMRDSTDTLIAEVSADEIFQKFNLFDPKNDNDWNGAVFRYQTINDVSYNKVTEAKLLPESFWFGNEIDRKRKIEKFRTDLFRPFKKKEAAFGKSSSSVYFPIARELKHLSESNSTVKRLLVYSDLMENTSRLSFYREDTLQTVQSHPELIAKILEAEFTLPPLNGIEIHLIYQPATAEADRVFRIVSKFYVLLLESKGAKVIVEANL